uniref:Short-chain dehydrogenase/reductase SDR n=1 Tax=Amphora coffeiformis TaxID=265554 RepID=A0A7S3L884_9STRA|mmetsp:Transcript_4702/g.8992  ORF Transcript_4702/g.8992 Transcript_4702/m.8992 type:complete len:217 (+) Transcript_4702:148-798(+)
MKVAAVFGYGPGLGAALAQKWSQQGFKVALLSRTLEKVEAAAKEIPNSKGVACDVSDMNSIETAVKEIESSMGPIDTVLWNAGSGVWDTWDKIDLDKFELSMRTNCSGLLKATQLAAPGMIERKEGGIYVTGATASLRGKPFTAGFAPAKGAQRLLAQSLARDLGPKGIHVGLFIIDGLINEMTPAAIAESYWNVASQPMSCWSFETELRPSTENW